MLRKLILSFFLYFALINSSYANIIKHEEILTFFSNITVNKNASIEITEKITVYADQNKIKHGLVRWLPIRYRDSYGISHLKEYRVEKIFVNNQPSAFHTENINNQFVIHIGEKNSLLTPGTYVYTIVYSVDNAINFLNDGDEFYWNITGNNWDFPILYAAADVTFPDDTKIISYAGYTGISGANEKNYTTAQNTENSITFATTRALNPKEGLTVAIAIPKGIINQPTFFDQIYKNPGEITAIIMAVVLLCYYLIAWFYYGRHFEKAVIIPLFEPPLNISAAAIRYIYEMNFDIKTFTTAIISMATKDFLTIKNEDDEFTLTKKSNDTSNLTDDEKNLAAVLFTTDNSIILNKSNAKKIQNAKNILNKALRSEYLNVYFVTNTNYLFLGWLITISVVLGVIQSTSDKSIVVTSLLWLSILSAPCYFLFLQILNIIKQACIDFSITKIFRAVFYNLFTLPFFAIEIFFLMQLSTSISKVVFVLLLIVVILNIVFYHLMRAPTTKGKDLMNHIEGFKMFLATTERYRLEQFNPPNITPQLFEKYLPYAIALNVENQWNEQFNAVLQQATLSTSYAPAWYIISTKWSTDMSSKFASNINSAITGALTSSTISSSASSGGSGRSGGGGGGGGGGGW